MENDPYVGKCYLGRIHSGILRVGDKIKAMDGDGKIASEGKCTKIFLRQGLKQVCPTNFCNYESNSCYFEDAD